VEIVINRNSGALYCDPETGPVQIPECAKKLAARISKEEKALKRKQAGSHAEEVLVKRIASDKDKLRRQADTFCRTETNKVLKRTDNIVVNISGVDLEAALRAKREIDAERIYQDAFVKRLKRKCRECGFRFRITYREEDD